MGRECSMHVLFSNSLSLFFCMRDPYKIVGKPEGKKQLRDVGMETL
jgi:hypothetical protein